MVWSPNRRAVIKAGAAVTLAGFGIRSGFAQEIPAKPEAGAVKMGIEPWLGYGQWHIAAKKDLFKAQGRGVFWDLCKGDLEKGLMEALATIESACNDFGPIY